MKYIYICKQKVREIISELNPAFPGTPIEERYAPEFLMLCVPIDDAVDVRVGYLYDSETGTFSAPVVEMETEAVV